MRCSGSLLFTAFVSVLLLLSTLRTLKKTRPPRSLGLLADHELPTLSVCIPARNETDDLQLCLEHLLGSDYPRAGGASAGRLLAAQAHAGNYPQPSPTPPCGSLPARSRQATGLAKNWAYEQLAREASGELLLFCGVDVRVTVHSLRQLVSLLKAKDKRMLSVMPLRAEKQSGLSLVQLMRYFWELAPPRRFFNRPPVLSTCWLIERAALDTTGGFQAVSRSIVPEAYFARECVKHDGYSFVRSSAGLWHRERQNAGRAARNGHPHALPAAASPAGMGATTERARVHVFTLTILVY